MISEYRKKEWRMITVLTNFHKMKTKKETIFDSFDIFFPTETWPNHFRTLFNSDHLNRHQRFELWLFFWRNGLTSAQATYHVLWQKPSIKSSHLRYDNSAESSLKDLEKKTYTNIKYLTKFPVIDLSIGRVTKQLDDGSWV